MTSKQLIERIQKTLGEVPESVLPEILKLLEEFKGKSEEQIKTSRNLQIVLQEDYSLLSKLAK